MFEKVLGSGVIFSTGTAISLDSCNRTKLFQSEGEVNNLWSREWYSELGL
jgi:hypothetical protein